MNSSLRPRPPHVLRWTLVLGLALAWTGSLAGARLLLLTAPKTWIVDDDGGPGVDFTDLQDAIIVAQDGDLILVRPGGYGDFALDEDLTILGEAGVRVRKGLIQGVDERASLAALEFEDLVVQGCSGTVVLDQVWGFRIGSGSHPTIEVRGCDDVRIVEARERPFSPQAQGAGLPPQVIVDDSRVELVASLLAGRDGKPAKLGNPYGEEGQTGVEVLGDGFVHLAFSSSTGGNGGDHIVLGQSGYSGDGGDGLAVLHGRALVTGRSADRYEGGEAGAIAQYAYAGWPGRDMYVAGPGTLRYSKVTTTPPVGGGLVQQPALPDPSLERVSAPGAGGALSMKLVSHPGAFSRLFLGLDPRVQATPGVLVESLLVKQTTIPLGKVPASGLVKVSLPLDPGWVRGTTLYAQAMSIFPGGEIRRTNSVPVVVR